jgi:myosin heavy subunit
VTLDEVCYRQTSTDEDLVRELSMAHAGKPNSVFHSDTKEANRFGVEHGPGVVWYNADNFILKNRDLLASSLSSLMQESGHSLIKDIFLNSTKNQSQTPRSPRLEQSVSALYLVCCQCQTLFMDRLSNSSRC